MLIFFWSIADTIKTGTLTSMTWCCHGSQVTYCLCTTSGGIDIVNPYWDANCYYAELGTVCNTMDYFNNKVLIGTQVSGIIAIPWYNVSIMETDVDILSNCYPFLDTASGIKSNTINKISSNDNYLTFITPSGLEWLKAGEETTIVYEDTDVADVYVSNVGTTYLATSNQLKVKDGEPTDFSTWDHTYTFSGVVNDVWVNELTNTVFVATSSGIVVFNDLRGSEQYKNYLTFSGALTYTGVVGTNFIAIEADTSYDWGHLFTSTNNTVFDIDLKLNRIMQTFEISSNIVDLEFPRFWTR